MLKETFILTLSLIAINAQQHHSFASTKFELSPELPAEDPIQISAQLDYNRQKARNQKPHRKHHVTKPVEAIPTAPQSLPSAAATAQPQAQQNQSLVPLRTLSPLAPGLISITPPTPPTFTPFSLPTASPPFGVQPVQPQIPPTFPQQPGQFAVPFQPQTQPTGFPAPFPSQQIPPTQQFFNGQTQQLQGAQNTFDPNQQGVFNQNQQQFQGQQPQFQGQQPQFQGQSQPDVQLSRATSAPERIELWFREEYDVSICKRDSRKLADDFRLKFPANILHNGKEELLSNLLAARLNDCFTKQESNHWKRVDNLIIGLNLPTTEEEECRTGLVQEQISCDNVFSYTCQFIQKAYNFRLVPTRIIIQEARIAEAGAEACRKVVRKIKKELQG